jgi:hypothetical protein
VINTATGKTPNFVGKLLDKVRSEKRHVPTRDATTGKSAPSTKRDAPHCTPKTSVSTPLRLPLSTRVGEISLRPAAHIGAGFGPFGPLATPASGPLQPSHLPQIFEKGALAGHGCGGDPQNRPPLRPLLPPAPLPRKRAAPPPCLVYRRATIRSPQTCLICGSHCWLAACSFSIWLACAARHLFWLSVLSFDLVRLRRVVLRSS